MNSMAPEDWNTLAVNELFDFNNGKAFYSDGYSDEGFRVIDLLNISLTGRLNITHKDKFVSPVVYRKYPKAHLKENDLIFIMTDITPSLGLIGETAVIDKNDAYVLNQRVGCLRPKTDISMSIWFFNYLFNSDIMRLQVIRETLGTAQFYLNTPSVKNLSCPTPPLPEQTKIASILTSVDEVIENAQKQIDKLQDLKKATMNELLTKGIGHTEFKDSELGRIPVEWEVRKTGEISASIVPGRNKPKLCDGGMPWITISDLQKTYVFSSRLNLGVSKIELSKASGKTIPPQTVIMSVVGEFGLLAIATKEMVINQQLHGFVCNESVLPIYLYFCLVSQKSQMERLATQTTISYMNKNNAESLLVLLPPLHEQQKIASILTSMDTQIEDKQAKFDQTQSLKKSLMQDLLTGKVRVTVN